MKRFILPTLLFSTTSLILFAKQTHSLSLTTLKPIESVTGWSSVGINKNIMGKAMKVEGKVYPKGISAHSISRLLYAIPKGATRFTVMGGLDDFVASQGAGSVVLRIEAGMDSGYLKDLAVSKKLTGKGTRSVKFDVKLPTDAKVLQLTIDDGGDGNRQDHVDWINPEFHGKRKLVPRKMVVQTSNKGRPKGKLPYWNDVSIVEKNRLTPRAHFIAYPDVASAQKGQWDRHATPFRKSLNGTWKFQYSTTPSARPKEFYKTNYNTSNWHNIEVPINWQIAGFGIPIYNNTTFPFNSTPPYIDQSFNPVGSYKRTFTIPKTWDGRRILIHFAGVDSAFTLWVNGKEVGYSEGSRTPAEFDITSFLKKGQNDLAVEVIRFSSGAWLEDQDFWRLSGIFRDVELISQPSGERITDFKLTTPLDKTYTNATFNLQVKLENPGKGNIAIQVKDAQRKTIIDKKAPVQGKSVQFTQSVTAPKLWSAETPNLYHLLITHTDKAGKVVQVIPWEFGFRSSEIKNNRLMVNGKPIIIAGINRHEHSATHGHYCTVEEIRADLIEMKKLNFNAIRTCHYPNTPELYALANELGLYVNDEANVESHAFQGMPNRPDMATSHHHRMHRMVERDKNFTSVISWSLGNESGSGGAHNDNYTWTKKHDYRPVAYQRHGTNAFTDFNAAFYIYPYRLAEYARNTKAKTMIESEYAHAMGNSTGNLREYWDIHWADNNIQGGFVWDWKDQGIQLPIPERSWITLPGINAKDILVEGSQLSKKGLRGILYFCDGSQPAFKAPWTLHMKLRTAPKSNDGLAFFPLFAQNSQQGAVFLEKNALVFQNFSKDRNKQIVQLPDTFFDGKEHTITVIQRGKRVSFFCDTKYLGSQKLLHSFGARSPGYMAFGPAVGTPLVPKRLNASAPTLLSAQLLNGALNPSQIPSKKPIVAIDFTQPAKIIAHRKAGGHFFAYGGYWENRRGHLTPGNFCMNGVLAADNTPHPGAYTFQYVQQPFETKAINAAKGVISIHNRNFFKPLANDILARWSLTANGKVIKSGKLSGLTIKPRETKKVTLPFGDISFKKGIEYRAQVTYELAKNTPWAKAGYRIAWDDFQVAYTPAPPTFAKGILRVEDSASQLSLKGKNFSVSFDKKQGALISFKSKGTELLAGPLTPNFWRGTTDNDRSYGQARLVDWKNIQSITHPTFTHRVIDASAHRVNITGDLGKTGAEIAMQFTVHADGQVEVKVDFTPKTVKGKKQKNFIIPRFGLRVELVNSLTHLNWYGHGPRETYIDRNYELIGQFKSTVDKMFTNYSRPQESGNIHGVRNASITDQSNQLGLQIIASAQAPVNISARRHKDQTLEAFKYGYQLPPSDKVFFDIDHRVNAVAGINTWGAKPLGKYALYGNKPMSYQFILRAK